MPALRFHLRQIARRIAGIAPVLGAGAAMALLWASHVPTVLGQEEVFSPSLLKPQVRRAPMGMPIVGSLNADRAKQLEQRLLVERVDPTRTLDLMVGRPTILRFRTPPFRDQLHDEKIAEALSVSETELSVTGKEVGTTVLNLWFKDPTTRRQEVLSYLIRVSDDPERSRQYDLLLENLERDINRGFPNSVVDLSYVGSQVVVRGKAKDIEEATHILRIVSQSLPTEEQVDQSTSILPVNSQNQAPTSIFPPSNAQSLSGFTIDEIVNAGGIDSVFNGQNQTGANAVQINNRVVNMLEIAGVHEVMVKVTVAEVVRDSSRSLIAQSRFGADEDSGDDVRFVQETGIGRITFQTNQFFLQFDALKRLGMARSLAEPNLTTLSGQPANFLVGGQFPVAESVSTVSNVNQSIRYVPFGIQLNVLPTVTDGDRIRLQLQATISETTNDNGDELTSATAPPSLTTRNFSSTIELRDTESIAIAGLIRNSLVSSNSRIPFLGDIPILGNAFSQKSSTYQEQELIVVVTPYLVSSIPAGQTPALPGSDMFEPDDLEYFIRGSMYGTVPEDYRSPVRSNVHQMQAFRCSEQKYLIGMPGHASGRPLPACPSPANDSPEQFHLGDGGVVPSP